MALTTEQITELARRYAPALYFHRDERFFPSDPKRFIERAALWRTRTPVASTAEWGEESPAVYPKHPLARARSISAADGPAEPAGTKPLRDLLAGAGEDRFFSLGGWDGSGEAVGADTENRFASLDAVAAAYRDDPELADSRFWFTCDAYDTQQLYLLAGEGPAAPGAVDFVKLLDQVQDPRLVLFHLFFPAHEEPLEGCEAWGAGQQFASFAGEWACIAVLEDGVYSDAGDLIAHKPIRLGLSQRNVGTLAGLSDDHRLGMQVVDWATVAHPDGAGDTAQLVVARGTHSLYADVTNTGPRPVRPYSSELLDLGRGSCGRVEQIDDTLGSLTETIPGTPGTPGGDGDGADVLLTVAAILASLFTGTGIVGVVALIKAAIDEASEPFGAAGTPPTTVEAPPPDNPPVDVTPTDTDHGLVIAPEGVAVPGGGTLQTWRITEAAAPGGVVTSPTGRTYPFVVDRATQVWWPSGPGQVGDVWDPAAVGYDGRWGSAVTHDPRGRRSGMRMPAFWRMFLDALAAHG